MPEGIMQKINVSEVAEDHRRSPKGKYERFAKNISVALGREIESTDLAKRQPFDLAVTRIPPGKSLCPYHEHSAATELYLVISGVGTIRDKDGDTEVAAGDAFFFGPNEAHQLTNCGAEDFVYYVIADNPLGDSCHYPDSGKWAVAGGGSRQIIHGQKGDYFDGEE